MSFKFGVLVAVVMVIFMALFAGCVNNESDISQPGTQYDLNVIKFLSKTGDVESDRIYNMIYEKYGSRINTKVEKIDIVNGVPLEFETLGYNYTIITYKPAAIVNQLFVDFGERSWTIMEGVSASN
jgi:hypothetical protein